MRTATGVPITDRGFDRAVEQRSHERLVLAAFVDGGDDAPVPDLERLCIDRGGCFDVVLVDFRRAPAAARRCRATGTPAVCTFRDGRALEHFDGPELLARLTAWLDATLPGEAARAVEAAERLAPDDPAAALAYTQALACDPGSPRALLALARLHAADGDAATALALATRVRADAPEAVEAARLADELRPGVDATGEEAALRARIAMNLEDTDTRIALVRTLWRRGKRDEAHAMTEDLTARMLERNEHQRTSRARRSA